MSQSRLSDAGSLARRRRLRRTALAALAAVMVAAGCGDNVSDDESATGSAPSASRAPASADTPTEAAARTEAAASETPAADAAAPADAEPPDPVAVGATAPAPASPAKAAAPNTPKSAPAASSTAQSPAANPRNSASATPAPGPAKGADEAPAPAPSAAPAPGSPAPGTPQATPGPKAPIVLGSFGTNSGPIGALMAPLVSAVKAWNADVNARGGVNGHPVRLLLADDGGDPNRALANVRKMIEEEGAIAIIGQHGPTTLDAVVPYLEAKRVPFIGGIPASLSMDKSDMSFPVDVTIEGIAWNHILPLTQVPGKHKVGIIYCREVAACSHYADRMKADMAKKLGYDVVAEAQASLAQPDFTSEILAARNAGADSLVAVMDNASVVRIARGAKRQGWDPLISVQYSGSSQSFFKQGGADVEGVLTSSTTADLLTSPKTADYRNAMARYQPGGETGGTGANGWAPGRMMEAAGRQLPDKPTSADVLEGLYALRGETLGGIVPPITYPRQGRRPEVNQCFVLGQVKGGRFVPKDNNPDQLACAPGWNPIGG